MKEHQETLSQFDAADREVVSERKRLFIGLISVASLLLCAFLALLWYVPYIGLESIHALAPWVLGALILVAMGAVCWAALGLVLNIIVGHSLPYTRRLRGLTIKLFLPLMVILGRVLGISKRRVRASFIKVNNELVLNEAGRYDASAILLLLPHCLQNSKCKVRLTYDINNCKRCGKCPIKKLLEISEHYGVKMAIATGGTIARRIVVQTRPRLILAVACERDLSSGIQDTYPISVYGVMNERPHGPCLDTQVSTDMVEKALQRFMQNPPEPLSATEAGSIKSGPAHPPS